MIAPYLVNLFSTLPRVWELFIDYWFMHINIPSSARNINVFKFEIFLLFKHSSTSSRQSSWILFCITRVLSRGHGWFYSFCLTVSNFLYKPLQTVSVLFIITSFLIPFVLFIASLVYYLACQIYATEVKLVFSTLLLSVRYMPWRLN